MQRKLRGFWLVGMLALVALLGLSLGILAVADTAEAVPMDAVRADLTEGSTEGSNPNPDPDSDSATTDVPSQPSGSEDATDPEGPEPDTPSEPEIPAVTAVVSPDERSVRLTGQGAAFDGATRVVFHVWTERFGQSSALRHEAVRNADGTWSATAFIATNGPAGSSVPYNYRVPDAVHRLYKPDTGEHLFTTNLHEADVLARSGWSYEGVAWAQPFEKTFETAQDVQATDALADPSAPDGDEGPVDDATAPEPSEDPADGPADGGDADTTPDPSDAPDADAPTGADPEEPAKPVEPAKPRNRPVYRLYNPATGDHHYTADRNEYDVLGRHGWNQEDVVFLSLPEGEDAVPVYRVLNLGAAVGAHHFTTDYHEYRTLVSRGWRDEGIAWYCGTRNSDGTWCASTGNRFHDKGGDYRVEAHVFAKPASDSAGGANLSTPTAKSVVRASAGLEERVAGQASFSISRPGASAHVANVNNARGTFDVVVDGLSSPSGVARVRVPSWTEPNGQDDLVWYEAARQGDGSYRATVDVARHTFDTPFMSHVYVVAGNGVEANVAQLPTALTYANYVKKTGGPYTYTLSIYNPGVVGRVQMPTWSEEGGQDDIVWYDARDEGNGWWSATIETSRLLHGGLVHTHFYADGHGRNTIDYTVEPWEILEWRYRNMYDRVRGLSSPSDYLLAVDTSNCFVGVFRGGQGSWHHQFWWDCAPGTWSTPTVKGRFSIGARGYSFGHGYTCYYWTQFYGDYWFHSIKYYPGTFNVLDGTLGAPASLGCVRLAIDNARWINENVPSGTTVLVY